MGLRLKFLAPLAISLLLVSGCSSTPEYDEVELVEYETCLNAYMNISDARITRGFMTLAMAACKDLKPAKR